VAWHGLRRHRGAARGTRARNRHRLQRLRSHRRQPARGHLLPALSLAQAAAQGHTPIAIVGGGTGLIGDPSGKSAERTLLTVEQVDANVESIRGQLSRFLDFDTARNPRGS
jgi:hypothetical protein